VREILGCEPADLVGEASTWLERVHPDDTAAVAVAAEQALESGGRTLEYRLSCRGGEYHWVRDDLCPARDADGQPTELVGHLLDVSAAKRVEEALRESERRGEEARRLEGLGYLAGGVAHHFNNLTTAVLGYTELLRGVVPAQGPAGSYLDAIADSGRRIADLTAQMLEVGRLQMLRPELARVDDVLREVAEWAAERGSAVVRAETPEPVWARVDPARLREVLRGLVENGLDAMPEGGRLLLRAVVVALGEGQTLPAGGYAALSVADTGIGMDAETQARLFEPFFTTKGAAVGTGLSLASSYGLIKQSGGDIQVRSQVGMGSRFTVYLPLAEPPRESAGPSADG
jgi:PAS domain S-box-containing protein